MKRKSIYTLIACLFLAACSSEEEWMDTTTTLTPEIEEGQVAVQLNLQTPDFKVEETRSANPLDLQIENPMYNLWLLHYNEEGGLVEQDTKYIHLDDKGELATNYTAKLTLTDGNIGTLCLVANLEGTVGENNPQSASRPSNGLGAWPKTIERLEEALLTLPINQTATDATFGLPSKMFMYGYYKGTLRSSHPVNITLGRMAARLDIIIGAANNVTLSNIRLQLKNAVIKSHYSPMKIESGDGAYVNFPEDKTFANKEVTKSSPITCYYFTGENIMPEVGKETTLVVKADKEIKKSGTAVYDSYVNGSTIKRYGTIKDDFTGITYNCSYTRPYYYKTETRTISTETSTYTIKLGANAPGTSDDYSLYRNNNYTFNINLK